MRNEEAREIANQGVKVIVATAHLFGITSMTETMAMLIIDDLLEHGYSFDEMKTALRSIRASSSNLKAITTETFLRHLPKKSTNYLPVEQAWAQAVRFIDSPSESIVMDDIISACAGQVQDLVRAHDRFGANKAFASFYEDAINEARRTGRKRACFISQGSNPEQTARVAREAANAGLIAESIAIAYEFKADKMPITGSEPARIHDEYTERGKSARENVLVRLGIGRNLKMVS